MGTSRRSIVLTFADDEQERSNRRCSVLANTTNRQSQNISDLNNSFQVLDDTKSRDHLQLCTKLFMENRINTKNAWVLRITEVTKHIVKQTHDLEALKIGGTSLEICAKVIGIRIDEIYSQGRVLATNLLRTVAGAAANNKENLENSVNDVENDETELNQTKKPRKKRFGIRPKNCIVNDVNKLIGKLKKIEPIVFAIKINPNTNPINNLFTNVLQTDPSGINFKLMCDEPYWYTGHDPLLAENEKKTFPTPKMPDVEDFQCCPKLSNFTLNELDDDILTGEKCSTVFDYDNVVYDDEGLPVATLDGSIREEFVEEESDENDEEDGNRVEITFPQQIDTLMQLKSTANILNSINKTNLNNNSIQNIIYGPSHWKLKLLKPRKRVFLKEDEKLKVKKGRKKINERVDFDKEIDLDDFLASGRMLKKKTEVDVEKIQVTLPKELGLIRKYVVGFNCLMTAPNVVPVPKADEPYVDEDVHSYNYDNANDSFYCNKNTKSFAIDDLNGDEDEIVAEAGQMNFLQDNLVDAPEMVSKEPLFYAKKAKQMNMHKLKLYVWKALTDSGTSEEENSSKTISTTFRKLHETLSETLPTKMKNDLSVGLSLVSVLHLCNEKELRLSSISKKDFLIQKMNEG